MRDTDRHELEQALRAVEDAWRGPGFIPAEVEQRVATPLAKRSYRASRCLQRAWRALEALGPTNPQYVVMLGKVAFAEFERDAVQDELQMLKCEAMIRKLVTVAVNVLGFFSPHAPEAT